MEKAEIGLRQVGCTETSASEPLMTYRNYPIDDAKTEGVLLSRDQSGGCSIFRPGGIRYIGGVNVYQAFVGNVRTCRHDAKGERRVSGPHKAKRTNARHRGGAARSSGDDS